MGSAQLARLLAPVVALDPTGRYRLLVAGLVAVGVAAAHLLGYCSGEACLGGEALALLLGSLGFVRAPQSPADAPAPLPPASADEIPFALLALAGVLLGLLAPVALAQPPGPAPAAAVPTPAGPPAADILVGPAAAALAADYEGADYEAPGFHVHGPGGDGDHPAELNGDGRPWPVRRLPYWIDWRGLGDVTPAQRDGVRGAFREAWGSWSAVADIQPVEVASEREALVYHRFGRIDGPLGTLAWSYLADGTLRPKEQRYDTGEKWTTGPPAAGRLSLPTVAAHEIGHVLGLGHDGASADALMRPSYSAAIPRPQPRDVARLVGLGYDRRR